MKISLSAAKRSISLLLVGTVCLSLLAGCSKKDDIEAAAARERQSLTQTASVKKEKYIGKEDFSEFLSHAEAQYLIPGLNEAAVPQGMDYSESAGRIFISNYYNADVPSVISALDAESGEFKAEYFLYDTDGEPLLSHVGGLAVNGDKLFVSSKLDHDGSYAIGEISLASLPAEGSYEVRLEKKYTVPVSPSFMSFSGGYLWLGNFYYPRGKYELSDGMEYLTEGLGCYVMGYAQQHELSEDGVNIPDIVIAAPDRIQGFHISDDGTVLLSQSYGRRNNSTLLRYTLDLSSEADTQLNVCGETVDAFILNAGRKISQTTAMPMTEALCAAPDGGTLVLFESGAMRYQDGLFRTDRIWNIKF